MPKPFRPMLAVKAQLSDVKWPVLISPKYDGVRAIVRDGVVLSRSLKPIPNPYVQSRFGHLEGADGELIVGDPTAKDVYNRTVSVVMSGSHDTLEDDSLQFYVFDVVPGTCIKSHDMDGDVTWEPIDAQLGYQYRLQAASDTFCGKGATIVPPRWVYGQEEALEAQQSYMEQGYEGAMLRDPNGPYKFGRSTVKEGGLLKMKLFDDAEATIIGFEEMMHNENDHIATTADAEAAGLRKRSTRKSGMVPAGVLGTLLCRTAEGVEFGIGSGFTALDREGFWHNRHNLIGKLVKYRFQPAGVKEKPRFPTFLGLRHPEDL